MSRRERPEAVLKRWEKRASGLEPASPLAPPAGQVEPGDAGPSGPAESAGPAGNERERGSTGPPGPLRATEAVARNDHPHDPAGLGFADWSRLAVAKASAAAESAAEEPADRIDPLRRALFVLVRWLRGHPVCLAATGHEGLQRLEAAALPDWRSLRERLTASLGSRDALIEAWASTWDAIRCPIGQDTVSLALKQAEAGPLPLAARLPRASRLLGILASALGWLQAFQPLDPICCPRERWADALEVSPTTISDLVRRLRQADLLREHDGGEYSRGRAIEYRFDCMAFEALALTVPEDVRTVVDEAFRSLPRFVPREGGAPRARDRLRRADEWRRRQVRRREP